jgi:hypothetical protein
MAPIPNPTSPAPTSELPACAGAASESATIPIAAVVTVYALYIEITLCHCLPITQGQSTGKYAAYVGFWMSGAVPNTLDWRVTWTRHAVDCVVLAVNIDDNAPSAFAA